MGSIIVPHRRPAIKGGGGLTSGTSYGTWDEITPGGWSGGAVNSAIWICNGSLGADQVGAGAGLSGADLVMAQHNNIAAATGSPLTRLCDNASSQYWSFTNAVGALLTGTSWSFALKLKDIHYADAGPNYDYLMDISGGTLKFWLWYNIAVLEVRFPSDGAVAFGSTPSTDVGIWIVGGRKAGAAAWCGWHTSKPTTKAGCSSSVTQATASSPDLSPILLSAGAGPSNYCYSRYQYVLFSSAYIFND